MGPRSAPGLPWLFRPALVSPVAEASAKVSVTVSALGLVDRQLVSGSASDNDTESAEADRTPARPAVPSLD
jgi:hypothetical protein